MTSPTPERSHKPYAVITGASSGIGLELARVFAANGYDLFVTAASERLDAAAAELRTGDVQVDAVRADLRTPAGVDALYQAIQATGRKVDTVCLNAGIGSGGPFVETDLQTELDLIQLNVASVVHLTKLVLRDMQARDAGRLLFTASIAGEAPGPFEAVYAASKAFVLSFALAVRNELQDTNIVVTALQPGATETDFFRRAGMLDTKVGASAKSDAADVAREGFDALMKEKDHVVAAMTMEKVQVAVGQLMPDRANAAVHRKAAEPGSGH